MEHELFVCACHNIEHQMVLSYFDDEIDVYLSVHLRKHGFWRRLWIAIRYIFGRQSPFGAFEEIILRERDVCRLNDILSQRREFFEGVEHK